jgi:uncharacterized Zn finger protein
MRGYGMWAPYVPVAARRRNAAKQTEALRKKGQTITPVVIEGRDIASTFWGKAWCTHLESYSDYANRLPRGRTYVRNGSVVHLGVASGKIEAMVQGSEMYTVRLAVTPLGDAHWKAIASESSGKIGSLVELLAGSLSASVMEIVAHRERGLFPKPREIKLACSCPDSASMCKHVAATLYGVGARLDADPALLFRLRGVDPTALLAHAATRTLTSKAIAKEKRLDDDALASVFGIELDEAPTPTATRAREVAAPTRPSPAVAAAMTRAKSPATSKRPAKAAVAPVPKKKTRTATEPTDARTSLERWELADAGIKRDALQAWIETSGPRAPIFATAATWRRVLDGDLPVPRRSKRVTAR